jgi:hypothetical protein
MGYRRQLSTPGPAVSSAREPRRAERGFRRDKNEKRGMSLISRVVLKQEAQY